MSTRRSVGDMVRKSAGAGFVMEPCWGVIQDDGWDYCMLDCGDPQCREWDTMFIFGRSLEVATGRVAGGEKAVGMACHVSECEMGS